MTTNRITLQTVHTGQTLWPAVVELRRQVFIEEQQVPEHEEWDGADDSSIHIAALALTNGETTLVGCARLTVQGQIGRMAVAKNYRLRGVGAALLSYALGISRRQQRLSVFLNAQTHAIGFYRRFGFADSGEEFMDAGIPHKRMELQLY